MTTRISTPTSHEWSTMDTVQDTDILLAIASERDENRTLEREGLTFNFKPEDFKGFVTTRDELLDRLRGGRLPRKDGGVSSQQLNALEQVGFIAQTYQPVTSNYFKTDKDGKNHIVSIIPIPTTSTTLLVRFHSTKQVSRVLKRCMAIGLIQHIPTTLRYGCINKTQNCCRYYAWNKSVEHLVLDCCKEFNISLKEEASEREDNYPLVDTMVINDADREKVTLRTRRIGVRYIADNEAIGIIKEKYRALLEPRTQHIKELNRHLPSELRIRFDPHVRRDRRTDILRIGYRATNQIVSLKNNETTHRAYCGRWRKEYMDEHFGTNEWTSYDVRASIFQISHLLNFGEWWGNLASDPYAEMYGKPFQSTEDREHFKSISMVLYFDNPSQFISHNNLFIPNALHNFGKVQITQSIENAVRKMQKFTGTQFFNEVFLHESLLYLDFYYELWKEGKDVVQIYDGFYYKKGAVCPLILEGLLRKCAMRYLEDYRKWLVAHIPPSFPLAA